jgi:large subunit ribosomal protein L25
MATMKQMKASARARAGKGATRAERRAGRVPGVIYGGGQPPLNVSVDHAELKQRIYAGRFLTSIYELDVDGAKQRVIPRDFQLDPVKDLPVHVDFLRLAEGAQIRVRIPVHVMNADQAPGVKRGGAVNIVTHTVEVVCSADAIPESIDVDISGLEINYSKHLDEIALPPNVRVVGRLDQTLVTIVPAAAAAAAAAGAPAEGAAPAAAPGAAPAAGAAPAPPAAEKK